MGKGMKSYSKGAKMQPKQTLKRTGLIASPGAKAPIKGMGK